MSILTKLVCDRCRKEVISEETGDWVRVERSPSGGSCRFARMGMYAVSDGDEGGHGHICPACLPSLLLAPFVTPDTNPYDTQLEHGTL